jgi:hypothetical protein
MRPRHRNILSVALLAFMVLPGCKSDEAKRLSDHRYVVGLQHQYWRQARQSLLSEQPNLDLLRAIERSLSGRAWRSIELTYEGPHKQELLDALKDVQAAYHDEVLAKVDTRNPRVALRAGVTLQQLRDAFARVDERYRRLEALTPEQ